MSARELTIDEVRAMIRSARADGARIVEWYSNGWHVEARAEDGSLIWAIEHDAAGPRLLESSADP